MRIGGVPRLLSRYCSYLLPKQAGGTTHILIFETLRMIRCPALYYNATFNLMSTEYRTQVTYVQWSAVRVTTVTVTVGYSDSF